MDEPKCSQGLLSASGKIINLSLFIERTSLEILGPLSSIIFWLDTHCH